MRKIILFLSIFTLSLFSQELPPPVSDPHITDDYGPRNLRGVYDWHSGIDYRASVGTTVRAVEGGQISILDRGKRAGWYIRIHGAHAYWTYMHLFSDNSNPSSGNWEARMATLENPNNPLEIYNRYV
ncbi:MAG: M23 family metallopeptidase, partial [candidate division WOR-3 bacterium]